MPAPTTDAVAVIGLGQMGSAMIARLHERGVDVIGWDVDAAARQRVSGQGIAVADSMARALAGRSYVLTSLPNADTVRAAWLGSHAAEGARGVAGLAEPGAVCIELSTIEPSAMMEIASHAAGHGLVVLDCPVSGGPVEARAGTLVMMVGGDPAMMERATPLLASLGTTIRHTGGIGTAKVVKIVNNMMAMGNLLIACEAFALGEAAGVDAATLFDVLAESGGTSRTFTKRFPNALRDDYAPRFKLQLAEKDLALGQSLARSEQIRTPACAQVRELFTQALQQGYGGQDAVALLAMYRQWARRQ
jgi:3-hydroxyisobutyrate dehydrogenase-like beta-hydroxyacid dehydrogenase